MPESAALSSLDDALALERRGPGVYVGQTSPAYWNRVGAFGGWFAAALLQAVLLDPDRRSEPLSMTVNFLSGLVPGAYGMRPRLLHDGRSSQVWSIDATQVVEGREALRATAFVTCALRKGGYAHLEAAMPAAPAAATVPPMRFGSAVPPFFDRYEQRYVTGTPFDAAETAESLVWTRDSPPRRLDWLALAGLCDVSLPRIFFRRKVPVPIATMTMTMYFRANRETLAQVGEAPVLIRAGSQAVGDGYFDQDCAIWSAAGDLLATSTQMVWFKM